MNSLPTATVSLTRGEDRVRSGHPWIYRADVADVARRRRRSSCRCAAPRGRAFGHALYSDRSQITLRMLTYGDRRRRRRAGSRDASRRRSRSAQSLGIDATAYRLVHGEADLLPSLIVDRYGDYLVVQTLSQGMDRLLPSIVVDCSSDLLHPRGHSRAQRSARARARRARAARRGRWPARCRSR